MSEAAIKTKYSITIDQFISLTALAFVIAVFLKNAWIAEDAYIIFRSLEQLSNGNGPIWNPHERVQVFTSSLWYMLLATARFISSNQYLNTLVISLALTLSLFFMLRRTFPEKYLFVLLAATLVASNSFFDFTSSGLENSLAYLLIAIFVINFLKLLDHPQKASLAYESTELPAIRKLAFAAGLIVCVRHDFLLIIAPACLYTFFRYRSSITPASWAKLIVLALFPLLASTLFSLIYYGFLFPNTAYAKLNTGISRAPLIEKGLNYLASTFYYDVITLLVIVCALVATILLRRDRAQFCLGAGIALYLAYIIWIGGDFMRGRFLSTPYLVAALVLITLIKRRPEILKPNLVLVPVIGYAIFYPHTPLNSPLDYSHKSIVNGVADERGFYFEQLSLARYIQRTSSGQEFPDHKWVKAGQACANSNEPVIIKDNIGLLGFFCGTDKIIIDRLALTDPLLARLPADKNSRIGHFRRAIPDGYLDSILTGKNQLTDAHTRALYTQIKEATQETPLLSSSRLGTILQLNFLAQEQR